MTAALADTTGTREEAAPASSAGTVPRPALRIVVRPAPRREPPFDDDLAGPPAATVHDQWLPFDAPPRRIAPVARPLRPVGLPDPAVWGRRLLVALVESAGGRRPLNQLGSLLSFAVTRGLATEFERAATARAPHWLRRATVSSVRASEPAAGVAELCAVLDTGTRVRAIALRCEDRGGRWVCTRIQLG